MKQAAGYRQHADDCRKLAVTARNEPQRRRLIEIAAAWEQMAIEREQRLALEIQERQGTETLAS